MPRRRPATGQPPGRPPLYPWDDWFARGDRLVFVGGTDYLCGVRTFCQQVYNAAAARGIKVRVQDLGDRVMVFVRRG